MTTPLPETLYSKLNSIRQLIEMGASDGEKAAAKAALDRLLRANKLTIDDLDPAKEQTERYEVRIRFTEEKDLVINLIAMVLNVNSVAFYRHWNVKALKRGQKKINRKLLSFDLTKAQRIQADVLIPYYLKAYRKSLKAYMAAFIQTNQLFPEAATSDTRQLTPEEFRRMTEASELARHLSPVSSPRKQLEVA